MAGSLHGVSANRTEAWRAVVRVLRSPAGLFHDVVTTIFPADCRCCDGPLLRAGSVPVCETCLGRVAAASQEQAAFACGRCGEALDLGIDLEEERFAGQMASALRCRECRMAPPPFERAVSFATYQDELRTLIGLLKFEGMRELSGLLGDRLADVILQLEGATGSELLVIAVPLFPARERQRGYNQSVLLADRALGRLRKLRPACKLIAAHEMLRRVRRTEAQFELSKTERRRNLRGAFEVQGDLRGREVVLVDDIMTSGATARECARVLRRAGATKVWVATLARAQRQEIARRTELPGELVAAWGSETQPVSGRV
jgi:ComF family protein